MGILDYTPLGIIGNAVGNDDEGGGAGDDSALAHAQENGPDGSNPDPNYQPAFDNGGCKGCGYEEHSGSGECALCGWDNP